MSFSYSYSHPGEVQSFSDEDETQILCCGKFDRKPGLKLITTFWALWTMLMIGALTLGIMV